MKNFITIDGLDDFKKEIAKIKKQAPIELDGILSDMAFDVEAESKRSMQGTPKTGRTYRRGSVSHTASSPGNAPAVDTGQLLQNISVKRRKKADYDVGSRKGAPHGFWLEFGTRSVAKRPWLTPAFDKIVSRFKSYL